MQIEIRDDNGRRLVVESIEGFEPTADELVCATAAAMESLGLTRCAECDEWHTDDQMDDGGEFCLRCERDMMDADDDYDTN